MAVEPYHRYSNEPERTNQDIYDDFELEKNPFSLHGLSKNKWALCYVGIGATFTSQCEWKQNMR